MKEFATSSEGKEKEKWKKQCDQPVYQKMEVHRTWCKVCWICAISRLVEEYRVTSPIELQVTKITVGKRQREGSGRVISVQYHVMSRYHVMIIELISCHQQISWHLVHTGTVLRGAVRSKCRWPWQESSCTKHHISLCLILIKLISVPIDALSILFWPISGN